MDYGKGAAVKRVGKHSALNKLAGGFSFELADVIRRKRVRAEKRAGNFVVGERRHAAAAEVVVVGTESRKDRLRAAPALTRHTVDGCGDGRRSVRCRRKIKLRETSGAVAARASSSASASARSASAAAARDE